MFPLHDSDTWFTHIVQNNNNNNFHWVWNTIVKSHECDPYPMTITSRNNDNKMTINGCAVHSINQTVMFKDA